MRIASKEAQAARKARHAHVVAMLNKAVPMKAKPAARVMMAKAAIVGKDDDKTQFYSSDSSNDADEADIDVDVVDVDGRFAFGFAVKPTARMQVHKRTDDALFEPRMTPETKLVTEIDQATHSAFNEVPSQDLAMYDEERYVDLETLKADVSDKFRGRFGFYLHRNLMADLQELDCLQDMAKIVQAEVARIGRAYYLDAIILVAHDLLVLRGVDKQMAAAIIARVSVRYHLL
jgi:hypothetical protein